MCVCICMMYVCMSERYASVFSKNKQETCKFFTGCSRIFIINIYYPPYCHIALICDKQFVTIQDGPSLPRYILFPLLLDCHLSLSFRRSSCFLSSAGFIMRIVLLCCYANIRTQELIESSHTFECMYLYANVLWETIWNIFWGSACSKCLRPITRNNNVS